MRGGAFWIESGLVRAGRNILVPVFGTKLDDDIVATAGRLAAVERGRPRAGRSPGSYLRAPTRNAGAEKASTKTKKNLTNKP